MKACSTKVAAYLCLMIVPLIPVATSIADVGNQEIVETRHPKLTVPVVVEQEHAKKLGFSLRLIGNAEPGWVNDYQLRAPASLDGEKFIDIGVLGFRESDPVAELDAAWSRVGKGIASQLTINPMIIDNVSVSFYFETSFYVVSFDVPTHH